MQNQSVVFRIGNESYGVDVDSVVSIIKMQEITRVPHAPEFIEGVTNLRGAVVPILDLRRRFGLPSEKPGPNTRIMIINADDTHAGLVVDAVTQVVQVPDDTIEPPPQMAITANSTFIRGIAKVDGALIILLDMKRVLTFEEKERAAG